jgi:type VI secretion system protein ImpH
VLEWLYPDRESVGRGVSPDKEVARFHSFPSLAFPPSPIYEITRGEGPDEPVHMTVAFMGLTGPQGVLPRHYTEMVMDRLKENDRTLLVFFDLFTHRFISLFYRAWEKYYLPTLFEQTVGRNKGKDPVSESLFALLGLGTDGLKENLDFKSSSLLGYVGLLSQRPRSAASLQQILQHYFELPVKVIQFIGEWLTLSEGDHTRLSTNDANNVLGATTVAGTRVWDQQARVQIQLGPLNLTSFTRMLPSGETYPALVQLTRFFIGQELNFDVRPILKAEEVPFCQLKDDVECPPRLGWTTWLKCEEFTQDARDVVFVGEVDGGTADSRRLAVA